MISITILILGLILYFNFRNFNYSNLNSVSFNSVTKLKWKQIKAFYNANPNRWKFKQVIEDGFSVLESGPEVLLFNTNKKGIEWQPKLIVRIQMPFYDYIKFLFAKSSYMKQKNKKNKIRKNSEGLDKIIETVKYDIEVLRKEAEKQADEANETMKKINDKLKSTMNPFL